MKATPHFLILTPASPGYAQATARAKRVFTRQEPGWKLADCDKATEPEKTKVIFRAFHARGGEVIALFPEIPADMRGNVQSYMHTGQHGAASPDLARVTRAATLEEYAPLAAELARIGYVLDIKTRSCPAYAKARREALAASRA